MDKQLLQDESLLGNLLDQVKKFTVGFRADGERSAGSTLRTTPDFSLPNLGDGAQDAMKVFEDRWNAYFAAFVNWQCKTSRAEEIVAELHLAIQELHPVPAAPPP
jgi:hypothetical protein